MPSSSVVTAIPSHVLLKDNHRIGPSFLPSESDVPPCKAIYGFSNKTRFDSFCMNSEQMLIPYPLVVGYLQNQIEEAGDGLTLVVLDATGPSAPTIYAATMEDVLTAIQNCMPHVTARHVLQVDQDNNRYRLVESPPTHSEL